jgi:methyl coenzyme M reductase subunit C-like uncharacterized protein (methanogenesis marker protein 7)
MTRPYRKGIEVEISDNEEVIEGREGLGGYIAATTYGFYPIIILGTIPRSDYDKIEHYLEEILEHEVIHIIIAEIEGAVASSSLDKLFPLMGDLEAIK